MEGKEVVVEAPATVAVPEMGSEGSVLSKERWEELRRLRAAGASCRGTRPRIARRSSSTTSRRRVCRRRVDRVRIA